MGLVYANIQLINADDMALARKSIIGEDEIKHMRVTMLVDSGAYMMAINESIQEQLQFPFKEKRKAQLADGSIWEYDVVDPVEVKFEKERPRAMHLYYQATVNHC